MTASTGIASINIGGITLYSWAGIRLGKEDVQKLHDKYGSPAVASRWLDVKTLVVDESLYLVDDKQVCYADMSGTTIQFL